MLVTFYKLPSGEINNVGKVNHNTNLLNYIMPPGWGILAGTFKKETHYILSGVGTLRPANPTTIDKTTVTADGADLIALTNIPDGATITITGEISLEEQAIGNADTLTFDTVGTYNILIQAFPYLNYEVTINAN